MEIRGPLKVHGRVEGDDPVASTEFTTKNYVDVKFSNFYNDLGSGSSLTVRDEDGTPTVTSVSTIRFTNGSVTDNGGGDVSVAITGGAANPGFYGIFVRESDGNPPTFKNDTLTFNSDSFYLTSNSVGKPIVNLRGVTGGSGVADHGALTGLADDDHPQYSLADGTRAFTGTVSGIAPTADAHLATKAYVDDRAGQFYGVNFRETDGTPPGFRNDTIYFDSSSFYLHPNSVGKPVLSFRGSAGGGVSDHGALTGLSDDDHPQYSLADGTRAFTGVVSGVTPTTSANLATKGYVDATVGPGFYGVNFRETDGNPPGFRNDTIYFNSSDFYLTSDSIGKPIVNLRGGAGGSGVTDHGALTGLTDDDHSQYLLASDATNRATFAANWTDLTDGGETSLHSHAGGSGSNFYAKMASGAEFGDTIVFADTDFNKSGHTLTVDETGLDHSQLANLTVGDPHTQYVLKTDANPGFYGVVFKESDGSYTERDDELVFTSSDFNVSTVSGKPTVTIVDSGIDHGSIGGLSDDDHPQYLLRTQAAPGFYGVHFRETDGNPPGFRNDTIYFNSNDFYLSSDSVGKPVLNFRGSSGGSGTALTVKDIDGTPTVSNVNTIQFTNGSVTNQGGGVAEVTLTAGGGISTLTVGANSYGSQTTLGFNAAEFYLSPGGGAAQHVVNLVNAPKRYTHTQSVGAQEWTVNHNLSTSDVVFTIYDTRNKAIGMDEADISLNTASFYFTTARAGRVVMIGW